MDIPHSSLAPEVLQAVIEEFVLREGTDVGGDVTLERKVAQVMQQLKQGTAVISFDVETESVTIVSRQ